MTHTRVDRMIAYLREHAEEIAALPGGMVQFDFGEGTSLSATIKRYERLRLEMHVTGTLSRVP